MHCECIHTFAFVGARTRATTACAYKSSHIPPPLFFSGAVFTNPTSAMFAQKNLTRAQQSHPPQVNHTPGIINNNNTYLNCKPQTNNNYKPFAIKLPPHRNSLIHCRRLRFPRLHRYSALQVFVFFAFLHFFFACSFARHSHSNMKPPKSFCQIPK